MPKLKDIKQEILQQHRQLAFNRRELSLRRLELDRKFRQSLHSNGALLGAFAGGLLLGWLTLPRPSHHGRPPLVRGLKAMGRWMAPTKGMVWSGLIKTATGYTAGKISGELNEHRDQ